MAMVSGLLLKMDGNIEHTVINNKEFESVRKNIRDGCRVEAVRINNEIVMYVDEYGKYKSAINQFATFVFRHFLKIQDTIHGNALFLGSTNEHGYNKKISAQNYKKIEELVDYFKDYLDKRFFGIKEKENMNDWFSKNTTAENLYVTQGNLNGTINMVVHRKDLAADCRKLLDKYKNSIIKYAVTCTNIGILSWINVEIECENNKIESQIIDDWQPIVEKYLPNENNESEDE